MCINCTHLLHSLRSAKINISLKIADISYLTANIDSAFWTLFLVNFVGGLPISTLHFA